MNHEELENLAHRYREILRQGVYLLRSIDTDGELSSSQVSTLNMLAAGPLRMGVIARNAGIRVPSATEQVIKLESLALVERIADESDARVVLVGLTAAGRSVLNAANARRNAIVATALKTLDANELRAVGNAIPAIAKLNEALAS